jgi:macrolide phosphotransferase
MMPNHCMPNHGANDLLAIAREHGLRLTPERQELDETGADFIVMHAVDEQGVPWVVRAPRRADVLARAATERRALELVRARLPVAVPEWRVFTPQLIAYPRLHGNPAAVVDMTAGGYVWRFDETAPPTAFLDALGDGLAALHRVEHADATAAGLPVRSPAAVRAMFADRMDRSRAVLDVPEIVWRRWQRWITDDTYWPEHSVLVHGDLHPAHVLIDDEHRVTGLLDWTEAHVGDPATDFALLFATLGDHPTATLLARYRTSGGLAWARMHDHIVETWSAYPVIIADFAMSSGEEAPRQLGQALVDANARQLAGT